MINTNSFADSKNLASNSQLEIESENNFNLILSPPSVPSNCVRIYVKHKDGTKHTNAKVSGSVCGGGVTKKVITNSSGYSDICYENSSSLCKVFIEGKEYTKDGNFKKGKEYTITIR